MIEKLVEQAPYITALVIIVYIFVKEMKESRQDYLKAQSERDRMFLGGVESSNKVIADLTGEISRNTEIIIKHDSEMKVTALNLEKIAKRK